MSTLVFDAMTELREFLYNNVYRAPKVHDEFVKAKKIIIELYSYFLKNDDALQTELSKMGISGCQNRNHSRARTVCDLIASMTDRYAMALYQKLFLPSQLF